MASASAGDVGRHLGQLFGAGSAVGLTDGELIERFAGRRDESAETAFETILARHGGLVLTVCRQVLGDVHAAEDAFQATFLVLVRRAASLRVRDRGSLGPWLYGVAYRIALKARQGAGRRRAREHRVARPPVERAATAIEDRELQALLHDEVNRLPAKYRAPVVLCYFEGRTHDEAAAALQWPIGTVHGRLARARDLLRRRLIRRGLAPAGSVGVSLLETIARAEVPAALRTATIAAAVRGTPTTVVADLAKLMLRSLLMARVKISAALLTIGLLAAGMGLALRDSLASQPPRRPDRLSPPITTAPPQPRLRASWKEKDAKVEVFSPDGRSLVSSGAEGYQLRDTETARVRAVLITRPHQIYGAVFSPDGRFLFAKVTSDRHKPVGVFDLKVWIVASGEVYATIPYISEHTSTLNHDFTISRDGRTLAFLDNAARLPMRLEPFAWSMLTGGSIIELKGMFNASPGLPRVKVWDVLQWKEMATLDGGSPMVFSPDGQTLVTGAGIGTTPRPGSGTCARGGSVPSSTAASPG